MLSENNEAIQSKIRLILKNSRNSARTIKREQERIRTQQIFILVHPTAGLRPVPHTQ